MESFYSVSFRNTDGSPAPANQNIAYNGLAVHPGELTKTGYSISVWYKEINCINQRDFSADKVTEDTTLYGKWKTNTYNVAYNANNGSGTMDNTVHTYDTAQALRTNSFTRTGYTFQGWATTSTDVVTYTNGQSVNNLTSTNNETVTLYAVWKANTYYVAYNVNGGTGTMANTVFTYGIAQNLRTNAFTRTMYDYLGWAESAAGDILYTNGQSVNNLTATNNGTVNLYAKWYGALWAKTITAGTDDARFYGVEVDHNGNVYAAGRQDGTVSYNYGNGAIAGTSTQENPILVKYGK